MSFTGRLKLGWLNRLKNCRPSWNCARSHFGIFVFFVKLKSVLKYEGPRKIFRSPFAPKSVSEPPAIPANAEANAQGTPFGPKFLSLLQLLLVTGATGFGKISAP